MASSLMPTDRLSTVDEHVERILESLIPLPPYDQPLLEALGLPVCEAISAPMDLPAFDNSAMDGYAVYFDDVASASEDHPVHLPVVGEMAAGQTKLFALSPGTTVRIMTGAPVPQGADAVVPVEWTDGGRRQRPDHPGARRAASTCATRARTCAPATSCSRTARCSARASSACSPRSAAPRCRPGRGPAW